MNKHLRRLSAAAVALAVVAVANGVVLAGGRPHGRSLAAADCALVLGARVYADGEPSPVLRDRLDEALAVWKRGEVRRILVSGDHGAPGYDEPGAMRAYLVARGVPASAVFMDHAGFDTYSSVWRARHVFGAESVVVVTQRFHLPRAVWVARSLGMQAEGRAADRRWYRGIVWQELREVVSRTKAVVDVARGRAPHHAGPPIPLSGDGRSTNG